MKIKLLPYIAFFYSVILSFVIIYILKDNFLWGDLLENSIFAICILLFCQLLNNIRFKRILLCLSLIVFYVFIHIEITYMYMYGSKISESIIYVLGETYGSEIGEYILMYLRGKMLFIAFLIYIPLVLFIYMIYRSNARNLFRVKSKISNIILFVSIVLISLFVQVKIFKLSQFNLPYTLLRSFNSYFYEMDVLNESQISHKSGVFSNVIDEDKEGSSTYIVIIGESAARSHYSLYNYYRNTNPVLRSFKRELYIYKDICSSHSTTTLSLRKSLTLANNSNNQCGGSIIQLMNMANYNTYWISNQRPVGLNETVVTKIAKASNSTLFLNLDSHSSECSYDDIILKPLKSVIDNSIKKKMIFIHLLGSHAKYSYRYPSTFSYFKDCPISKYNSEHVNNTINNYDNSIRYNDYIVSSIINMIKKSKTKSYVLYFSDHGEEVFDTINMCGHVEPGITKNMYEIPFILWMSEKYKKDSESLRFNIDDKYVTDNLLYSIASLSKVSFKEFIPELSLFDKGYKNSFLIKSK